jgi:hypothetical protein
VAVNYMDATQLSRNCAPEQQVRRAPGTGRYVLTNGVLRGPAMVDTTRAGQAAPYTATLDEVLCIGSA